MSRESGYAAGIMLSFRTIARSSNPRGSTGDLVELDWAYTKGYAGLIDYGNPLRHS
jgi:hypothetical protein